MRTDPGAEQNIMFSSVSSSSNVGTSTFVLGFTSQNVMPSSAFSINYNSQSGFIGDVHLSSTHRFPPRNLVEEHNATLPSIMAALGQFSHDWQSALWVAIELLQVANGATWRTVPRAEQNILFSSVSSSSNVGSTSELGFTSQNVMPSNAFSINYNSQSGFIGDVHLSSTLGIVDSMMREEEHNATLPSIMAALEQFSHDRQSALQNAFELLQVANGATWQYERTNPEAKQNILFSSVSSSSNVGTSTSELGITSQNVMPSSAFSINYNSRGSIIGDVHLSSTPGFPPRNLVEEYEERLSNFLEPAILRPVDSMMREEEHNATLPSIMAALEQFSHDRQSALRRTDPGAEQNILFSSVSSSSNVGTSTFELGFTSQNVMPSSAFSINYNSHSGFIGDVDLSSTPGFPPRNLVEEFEERLSNFLEPIILRPVDSMIREEEHNATLFSIMAALEQFSHDRQSALR
ncbi:unnamed protein product [Camellia sinensis]